MELETFFSVSQQLKIFALSCAGGAFIGVLYDVFRAVRLAVPHGRAAVFAEDCLFFILSGIYLVLFAMLFARGQLRMYMVLGSVLGFTVYILSVGRVVIGVLLKIKRFITAVINFFWKPICKMFKYISKKLCNHTIFPSMEEKNQKNLDLEQQDEV